MTDWEEIPIAQESRVPARDGTEVSEVRQGACGSPQRTGTGAYSAQSGNMFPRSESWDMRQLYVEVVSQRFEGKFRPPNGVRNEAEIV